MTEPDHPAPVQAQTVAENVPKALGAGELSRQLNDGELRELKRTLQHPLQQLGCPASMWMIQLVHYCVRDSFEVVCHSQFIDRLVERIDISAHTERSEQ